jgi:hypothetical protein
MPRPSAKTLVRTLVVMFLVAQVVRPARSNPPVDPSRTIQAQTAITAEVSDILERSCRDCHSHATVWPWYSNVAPISWLLVSHVNEGRRHFSMSDWAGYTTTDARKRLEEMCAEVRDGEMPMTSYVLAHRAAALTDADRRALCAWTEQERAGLGSRASAPPAGARLEPR